MICGLPLSLVAPGKTFEIDPVAVCTGQFMSDQLILSAINPEIWQLILSDLQRFSQTVVNSEIAKLVFWISEQFV